MDYHARRSEILGLSLIAITIMLFLALVTDGYQSDIRRPLDGMADVPNLLGKPGATVAGILSLLLGGGAHCLYFVTGVWGGLMLSHRPLDRIVGRVIGAVLLTFATSALLHVDVAVTEDGDHLGGIIGGFFGTFFQEQFGIAGANVICVTLILVGTLLSTELLLIRVLGKTRVVLTWSYRTALEAATQAREMLRMRSERPWRTAHLKREPVNLDPEQPELLFEQIEEVEQEILPVLERAQEAEQLSLISGYDGQVPERPAGLREEKRIRIHTGPPKGAATGSPADVAPVSSGEDDFQHAEPAPQEDDSLFNTPEPRAAKPAPAMSFKAKQAPMPRRKNVDDSLPDDYVYPKRYTKPSLDLFDVAPDPQVEDWSEQLLATSALLEETLQTFGIEARVTDVTRGPTITRYELEPAPGIKVSRFASLADDIALALKAHRVRVEAPIPGKGRVGIEVPNRDREPVVIRELLESRIFGKSKGSLPLTLGKDIAGEVMVADLATMPHLLVA
ncbi:MAG: DNA translocase FtsK 4TM domain-containing protein, partial [Candidatus Hydrogenedentes bacterium]|nr:DNA translocase FtsK 4TM domain-containing protein [Candidatus Hydrogenedentota bacterium]